MRILAFDIDGTLTDRLDWIDPQVVQALANLAAQDWQIVLLTGRTFSFALQILQYFSFPYILAVQNGADILTMPEKKRLNRHYFSSMIVQEIEKLYEGYTEDFIIYTGMDNQDFCYYRPEKFSKPMLKYLKILEGLGPVAWEKCRDFSFDQANSFPLIKCFGEKNPMQSLYEKLKVKPEIEVSLIKDPIDPSLYLNLITHPKANKGQAIRSIRDYCKSSFVIAAGDDHNDLKMLQEADVAIVIETAPEHVLSCADIKAKPAKELGILAAIQEAIKYEIS